MLEVSFSLPKYPSSYESDYGHVDEYNTNDYKHEAAYAKVYINTSPASDVS